MDFLSLPVLIVENILSFLSYDEIAKARLVCRNLDQVCQRLLNRGFVQIERRHAYSLRAVKARLPRRESERRMHYLSRHCDILSAIETRISMLNMTYTKFIENRICCFIPGRVIDEIKRVLDVVEQDQAPPRAHEVLQELRDISSMAIEHFDEKISPALRKTLQIVHEKPRCHAVSTGEQAEPVSTILDLQRRSELNAKLAILLSKQLNKFKKKMVMYRRIALRERLRVSTLVSQVTDQALAIADLKKRVDECDIKYTELTHTNQAVGVKTIPGAAAGDAPGAMPGQHIRSFSTQIKLDPSQAAIGAAKANRGAPNIKPRKPVIRLPSVSEDEPPQQGSSGQTDGKTDAKTGGKTGAKTDGGSDNTRVTRSTKEKQQSGESSQSSVAAIRKQLARCATPRDRNAKRSLLMTIDTLTDLSAKMRRLD